MDGLKHGKYSLWYVQARHIIPSLKATLPLLFNILQVSARDAVSHPRPKLAWEWLGRRKGA